MSENQYIPDWVDQEGPYEEELEIDDYSDDRVEEIRLGLGLHIKRHPSVDLEAMAKNILRIP